LLISTSFATHVCLLPQLLDEQDRVDPVEVRNVWQTEAEWEGWPKCQAWLRFTDHVSGMVTYPNAADPRMPCCSCRRVLAAWCLPPSARRLACPLLAAAANARSRVADDAESLALLLTFLLSSHRLPMYNLPSPCTCRHTTMAHHSLQRRQLFELAYGEYRSTFDLFVIGVIVVAGIMVGIQTYPQFKCPVALSDLEDDHARLECTSKGWGGTGSGTGLVFGDGGILDVLIMAVFCAEVTSKPITARKRKKPGWLVVHGGGGGGGDGTWVLPTPPDERKS